MIIARDPTAKVCLTSLFFWIPGRGSVLINAHHVFFSMLVFRRFFFLFYLRFFEICPWVLSVWCDISYVALLFSFWYIYALCSREWCSECIFLAGGSGEWPVTRPMDHRLFDGWLLTLFMWVTLDALGVTATPIAFVFCMEIKAVGSFYYLILRFIVNIYSFLL